MTLAKRFRIFWAALTQQWREETCTRCGDTWFSVSRSLPTDVFCMVCEERQRNAWVTDFLKRVEEKKGVA